MRRRSEWILRSQLPLLQRLGFGKRQRKRIVKIVNYSVFFGGGGFGTLIIYVRGSIGNCSNGVGFTVQRH